MKLKISNLRFTRPKNKEELLEAIAELKGPGPFPLSVDILLESQDRRNKIKIFYCYTVEVVIEDISEELLGRFIKNNSGLHIQKSENSEVSNIFNSAYNIFKHKDAPRVLIVGSGPAGLFAAHLLLLYGFKVRILERGKSLAERDRGVSDLFTRGIFSADANLCFGEGGAGTYSDGKLTSRKHHPYKKFIFETLVSFGAPEDILVSGKPHIGTDQLHALISRMNNSFREQGAEVFFEECLIDLEIRQKHIVQATTNKNSYCDFSDLILAIGHSARDTYRLLHKKGIYMEQKPFAVGVRCEHGQDFINRVQYGASYKKGVPAADYKLVHNISETRSTYSFCMCPGGTVVCSSASPGCLSVNGMSNYSRNSVYANAALVVKVSSRDFGSLDPLAGLVFQEQLENRAFIGPGYVAPAQRLTDFMAKKCSGSLPESSYRPGLTAKDLHEVLPDFISSSLEKSLPIFNKKIPGFISSDAVLIGTETKTSAPVTIKRDETGKALDTDNLYPAGEGSGYSGGIVSAALDGIHAALHIIKKYERNSNKALA
jgi:uncharacterized FAD-dependent dehydrogenase